MRMTIAITFFEVPEPTRPTLPSRPPWSRFASVPFLVEALVARW